MRINRRAFLEMAAAAGFMLDTERLLWTPGEKTIFLPSDSFHEYPKMVYRGIVMPASIGQPAGTYIIAQNSIHAVRLRLQGFRPADECARVRQEDLHKFVVAPEHEDILPKGSWFEHLNREVKILEEAGLEPLRRQP